MYDKPIILSDGKYAAPSSGWYTVKAEVFTFTPTGEYETILNPDKKWWQFWKKRYIIREIYKTEKSLTGSEVRLLAEGEIIDVPILYKI